MHPSFASDSAETALAALARFDGHRFGPLLHHYELSNWVLCARACGQPSAALDGRVQAVDRALRAAPVALDWVTTEWVLPALARGAGAAQSILP